MRKNNEKIKRYLKQSYDRLPSSKHTIKLVNIIKIFIKFHS